MSRQLEITVDKDGRLTIRQKGVAGPACLKDLDKIIASLKSNGVELSDKDTQKTPEYYRTTTTVKETVAA